MSFAVVAHVPEMSLVAVDERESGRTGTPGEVHFDLGGKLHVVPGGWAACTGGRGFTSAILRQLSHLNQADGPQDHQRALQEGWRRTVNDLYQGKTTRPHAARILTAVASPEGPRGHHYHSNGQQRSMEESPAVTWSGPKDGNAKPLVQEHLDNRDGTGPLLAGVGALFRDVAGTSSVVGGDVQIGLILTHTDGRQVRGFLRARPEKLAEMSAEEIEVAIQWDPVPFVAGPSGIRPAIGPRALTQRT